MSKYTFRPWKDDEDEDIGYGRYDSDYVDWNLLTRRFPANYVIMETDDDGDSLSECLACINTRPVRAPGFDKPTHDLVVTCSDYVDEFDELVKGLFAQYPTNESGSTLNEVELHIVFDDDALLPNAIGALKWAEESYGSFIFKDSSVEIRYDRVDLHYYTGTEGYRMVGKDPVIRRTGIFYLETSAHDGKVHKQDALHHTLYITDVDKKVLRQYTYYAPEDRCHLYLTDTVVDEDPALFDCLLGHLAKRDMTLSVHVPLKDFTSERVSSPYEILSAKPRFLFHTTCSKVSTDTDSRFGAVDYAKEVADYTAVDMGCMLPQFTGRDSVISSTRNKFAHLALFEYDGGMDISTSYTVMLDGQPNTPICDVVVSYSKEHSDDTMLVDLRWALPHAKWEILMCGWQTKLGSPAKIVLEHTSAPMPIHSAGNNSLSWSIDGLLHKEIPFQIKFNQYGEPAGTAQITLRNGSALGPDTDVVDARVKVVSTHGINIGNFVNEFSLAPVLRRNLNLNELVLEVVAPMDYAVLSGMLESVSDCTERVRDACISISTKNMNVLRQSGTFIPQYTKLPDEEVGDNEMYVLLSPQGVDQIDLNKSYQGTAKIAMMSKKGEVCSIWFGYRLIDDTVFLSPQSQVKEEHRPYVNRLIECLVGNNWGARKEVTFVFGTLSALSTFLPSIESIVAMEWESAVSLTNYPEGENLDNAADRLSAIQYTTLAVISDVYENDKKDTGHNRILSLPFSFADTLSNIRLWEQGTPTYTTTLVEEESESGEGIVLGHVRVSMDMNKPKPKLEIVCSATKCCSFYKHLYPALTGVCLKYDYLYPWGITLMTTFGKDDELKEVPVGGASYDAILSWDPHGFDDSEIGIETLTTGMDEEYPGAWYATGKIAELEDRTVRAILDLNATTKTVSISVDNSSATASCTFVEWKGLRVFTDVRISPDGAVTPRHLAHALFWAVCCMLTTLNCNVRRLDFLFSFNKTWTGQYANQAIGYATMREFKLMCPQTGYVGACYIAQ